MTRLKYTDCFWIIGCGRFFEGNAEEMHKALNETLASLPDDTKVYVGSLTLTTPFLILTLYLQQPGHEYTKSNVRFAKSVLENDAIKKLEEFAQNNKETQGKFTIGDEKVSRLQQICNLASRLILVATQCVHESKRVYILIPRAYPMKTHSSQHHRIRLSRNQLAMTNLQT